MPISRPNFDLSEQYVQLAMELDLPEVEMEGVSPEEARRRSESMRAALLKKRGTTDQPGWFDDFEKLLDGGWPWRQAVYIAWASIPRENRVPRTQNDLAIEFLGLTSDRAIATWRRRNPAIDEMIAVLQSAPLWEHRAEVYQALIEVAKQQDYKGHNDRKLFLELIGDYMPAAKLEAILRGRLTGGDIDTEDEDTLTETETDIWDAQVLLGPMVIRTYPVVMETSRAGFYASVGETFSGKLWVGNGYVWMRISAAARPELVGKWVAVRTENGVIKYIRLARAGAQVPAVDFVVPSSGRYVQ